MTYTLYIHPILNDINEFGVGNDEISTISHGSKRTCLALRLTVPVDLTRSGIVISSPALHIILACA